MIIPSTGPSVRLVVVIVTKPQVRLTLEIKTIANIDAMHAHVSAWSPGISSFVKGYAHKLGVCERRLARHLYHPETNAKYEG